VKCAQCLRGSTTEHSHENQLPDLEALACGFEIVSTYAEKVSAGKQRPAFDKMLADAHTLDMDDPSLPWKCTE